MARFAKDFRGDERERFVQQDEARRRAGRSFEGNRFVRCKQCQFTISEAEGQGLEACPRCGSAEPGDLLNLPYDPQNERASLVTLKQALKTERANRVPGKVR